MSQGPSFALPSIILGPSFVERSVGCGLLLILFEAPKFPFPLSVLVRRTDSALNLGHCCPLPLFSLLKQFSLQILALCPPHWVVSFASLMLPTPGESVRLFLSRFQGSLSLMTPSPPPTGYGAGSLLTLSFIDELVVLSSSFSFSVPDFWDLRPSFTVPFLLFLATCASLLALS